MAKSKYGVTDGSFIHGYSTLTAARKAALHLSKQGTAWITKAGKTAPYIVVEKYYNGKKV